MPGDKLLSETPESSVEENSGRPQASMWLKFPVPGPEQVNYGKRAHVILLMTNICVAVRQVIS